MSYSINTLDGLVESSLLSDVLNDDKLEGLVLEKVLDVLSLLNVQPEPTFRVSSELSQEATAKSRRTGTHLRSGPNGSYDLEACLEEGLDDVDTDEA